MTRHEPLETFTNYLEYVILLFVGCHQDAHFFKPSSEQDQIYDGWL